MDPLAAYSEAILPAGIRSRFVDNINGLTMHVLEAGFEAKGRPCLLLLHGFPELAYSWRKVMLPLAQAGFHVVAPDQRGYGRTTGSDVDYDDDLGAVPPAEPGERHAGAGASRSATAPWPLSSGTTSDRRSRPGARWSGRTSFARWC